MPEEAEPPPKKFTFKAAEFESVNTPEAADSPPANDPMEMLQANRAHEKANNTIFDQSPKPVWRIPQRIREFLIVFPLVNLAGILLLFVFKDDIPRLYLMAGMLIFSSGYAWVTFVIRDD